MNRAAKRLEQMRSSPNGDWKIEDVQSVCAEHAVECKPPKRGDHYKITHPSQEEILTIPARRPIKPVYIRKLLKFLDNVAGTEP